MGAKKIVLGKSPILTTAPAAWRQGTKPCWRQPLEPRLAGLGQACKANFPPCKDSQLGHGNLQPCFGAWPLGGQGCPTVRVTAGPTGLRWEDRTGWACLSWGRTRTMGVLGESGSSSLIMFVMGCKQVFLGKRKWRRGLGCIPTLSKLPGKPWVPEENVGTLLFPKDGRNTGRSKGIFLAQLTQWPIFFLLGYSGAGNICRLDDCRALAQFPGHNLAFCNAPRNPWHRDWG